MKTRVKILLWSYVIGGLAVAFASMSALEDNVRLMINLCIGGVGFSVFSIGITFLALEESKKCGGIKNIFRREFK